MKIDIKNIELDLIKPYWRNAKKHPKRQVEQIAASITEFGFNQPIVLDKNNIIVVGHGRFEAAKHLNLPEVPVLYVELSEEKAKAYRLADNKLNESPWIMDAVLDELREIPRDLVELTGFSLDLLVDPDDKDDVLPTEATRSKAKKGDLFFLGEHLLLCGDATLLEDVDLLLANKKVDMVFTDPPYNVNYSGRGKNTSEGIENDNMSPEEFDLFLGKVFANYRRAVRGGAAFYVFHSSSSQRAFELAMQKNDIIVKNQIVWNKPTASMGWGDYRWKHEPFFYAGMKEEKTEFYGDRTHSTIWDFQDDEKALIEWAKRQKKLEKAGLTTIWTMKRDNVQEYKHPTQKPVELICHAIGNSSKAGEIVLDFFGGSGSTMIACEKMNRVNLSMELDPKYCDLIVQRYVDYTAEEDIQVQSKGKLTALNWPMTDKAKEMHLKANEL